MKKLIFTALLLPVSLMAQDQFTKTANLDSVQYNKSILYSNALTWVSTHFKSSESVIDLQDKEMGKIIVKCNLNSKPLIMGSEAQGVTHARITIQVKDGKYKIAINDINFDYYNAAGSDFTYLEAIEKSEKGVGKKSFQDYVFKVDKEVPKVIESFEKEIKTLETF